MYLFCGTNGCFQSYAYPTEAVVKGDKYNCTQLDCATCSQKGSAILEMLMHKHWTLLFLVYTGQGMKVGNVAH